MQRNVFYHHGYKYKYDKVENTVKLLVISIAICSNHAKGGSSRGYAIKDSLQWTKGFEKPI